MWTETKLNEVAEKYVEECEDLFKREHRFPTVKTVFLAGCKYIINNTQKEI